MINEMSECDAFGIQIDGSSDRQQLGIKFITGRIMKDAKCKTRFLAAVEPKEKGAKGLLDRGVRKPADLTSHSVQFKDVADEDGFIETTTPPTDLSHPVFQKMMSLSTDGESANTGRHSGLWKLVEQHLDRYIFCMWCVCHRSDLVFHDMVSSVPELKRWYSQVKQTVKFFHVSAKRTPVSVKKHSKTFLTFVNPPDVRFAEYIFAMCKSVISNMDGMMKIWEEIYFGKEDRYDKAQATGFMKMWDSSGQ